MADRTARGIFAIQIWFICFRLHPDQQMILNVRLCFANRMERMCSVQLDRLKTKDQKFNAKCTFSVQRRRSRR